MQKKRTFKDLMEIKKESEKTIKSQKQEEKEEKVYEMDPNFDKKMTRIFREENIKGGLLLYKEFITNPEDLFEKIHACGKFEEEGKIMGVIPLRKVFVLGEESKKEYGYSGVKHKVMPWSDVSEIEEMKTILEEKLQVQFTYAVINYYPNGNSAVGKHSDMDKDLDDSKPIISVTLGEERTFIVERTTQEGIVIKVEIPLPSGSLLIMEPGTQSNYQHYLKREPSKKNSRINITFRVDLEKSKK